MIKCIIVDDEPLGRNVLEKYVSQTPGLQIAGIGRNAFEASQILHSAEVDLLFLDINMPGLSGISLVKSLTTPPKVIFVTAYPEYAVEGFELNALDYLVKPVSYERFLKSVNKARESIQLENKLSEDTILLKADKKLYKIRSEEILIVEAFGDYLKVHLNEKTILTNETMKSFLEKLPTNFQRIHKSFIINLNKIEFVEGNYVRINKKDIPVGGTYREAFATRLKD